MKASSRRIEDLVEGIQPQVRGVLVECERAGVDILVTSTFRSLKDQARLFRKTRTQFEIARKISSLNLAGFSFLADVLDRVGPQAGPLGKHVTNAGPGESWHNYGLAFDAVPLVQGKPDWDPTDDRAWEFFIGAVENNGLESAARWVRFREWPHAQQRGLASNPLNDFSPASCRALLEKIGAL